MRTRHLVWLMSCTIGLSASRPASAQTYTCLSDTTHDLYYYVVRLVTSTDSDMVVTRRRYKLPSVDKSKVSVVTTSSVCNQAGAAYHASVTPPGTPAIPRTLVVIKGDADSAQFKNAVGELRAKALKSGEMKAPIEVDVNASHTVTR